ncbi:DUF2490 domain-containing protein [Flavobacteriales bacterium]|jgi:hypothetical protein|nr:DUF2490 domain-containing protein [Flavobacteriales bacterium]
MKSASILFLICLSFFSFSQINQDQFGSWEMYFYKAKFKDSPWGIQGDFQLRNWNVASDLEQLLLRSGLTYQPKGEKILFTLGYANIQSGTFGEDKSTVNENRFYQEALFPVQFGKRVYTNHRFRYEQRETETAGFRTRYRYNLFLNIALNKASMEKGTLYLALYNEIFVNGEKQLDTGVSVETFDRNRFYTALGYKINDKIKVQAGIMNQSTNNWRKNQLQISLHQSL